MNAQKNCEDLMVQINHLRGLMISTGLKKGLSNTETLKYSEKLDKLIVQFQIYGCLNK
ncbi:MAG TPA: aspartyl-phosphate phosphatase Spo0E family protein [Chondromyces sp.]|nr:aspartyl-phosphate phosphatase Spo0E family protein [Chondromyces sp.]